MFYRGLHMDFFLLSWLRQGLEKSPRSSVMSGAYPLVFPLYPQWEVRIKTCPAPGKIRLLTRPDPLPIAFLKYWYDDMSLTEWAFELNRLKVELEKKPVTRALSPPDFLQKVTDIFEKNQRSRWLASVVLQRWKQRVWKKRTQCNVDMIDMLDIKDRDAILITDTKQRQIFRFHRRDLFSNLIANICMSEEMMPYPRPPTNPWSNVPWTFAQTMSVCAQLCLDYAKRGKCPPVLLAAFCAAKYDLKRFRQDNASMVSQNAIYSYFKDLTTENMATVYDTIVQLLSSSMLNYSPAAINRWLRQTPQTPLHREWLLLVRDYTVYINLHVQVRPTWRSKFDIRYDVRNLYARTTSELPVNPIRFLGQNQLATAFQDILSSYPSGPIEMEIEPMDTETALMLIGSTLFR
jgi:hypothetical protein